MLQRLDHDDAGAFTHNETVTTDIERPRGAMRRLVESGRQGAGGGETSEADGVDAGFRPAADRNIRLLCADHPGRVADCLDTGGAGGYRGADRPFETVTDRNLAGGEVHEKRGHGEGREPPHTALVNRADRLRDCREAADAGRDHRGRALLFNRACRLPAGLLDCLFRRRQRQQDKAVHLALVLRRNDPIGIEAIGGILGKGGHRPTDLAAEFADDFFRQKPKPRVSGKKPRPACLHARCQRADRPHSRYDDATHRFS